MKIWPVLLIIYLMAVCITLFMPGVNASAVPSGFDKIVHLGEFMVLAFLFHKALGYYTHYCLLYLFVLAIASEIIQYYIPGRTFSWLDFIADAYGISIGTLFYMVSPWK